MSVLKLSKNDIIRNEDKEDKIKLKKSDLSYDSAMVSGWEQANRQSLDIINNYNNRINKSEWLDKEDRAKYRSALDSYIETSNYLRNINKTFGEGYSDEDEQKWTDSIASMNKGYEGINSFYGQFASDKVYGDWMAQKEADDAYNAKFSDIDVEKASQGWQKYLDDEEVKKNAPKYDLNNDGKDAWWEKALGYLAGSGGGVVDTTLPNAGVTQTIHDLKADNSHQRPNESWSEEQRNVFGQLYAESPYLAYNFAEETNKRNNKAKEEAAIKEIQESATSSFGAGLGHTIGAIAAAPLKMADFLGNLAYANAGREITDDGSITPGEYSDAVIGGISTHLNEYGTLNESVPIIGGKGWGDVYGLGTSIAQSMASAYTLGSAGTLVSYFGQGAASAMESAMARGVDEGWAGLYGVTIGAIEGAAESMGIDNLFKLGSASTLKGLLKNVVKQAGAEGLEEGVTAILSNIADAWMLQDKSEFAYQIAAYQNEGLSESDAKWKVFWDSIEGIAFDTIAGAASGSVSGGIHSGVQTAVVNADAKKNYSGQVEGLLIDAGSVEGAGKTVDKLVDKYGKKGELSGWDINHLLEITDTAKVKSAVEGQLTKLGEQGDVSKLADVITKQVQGIELSKKEQAILDGSKYGQRILNTLDREKIKSGMYDTGWTKGIGTRRLNADVYNKSLYDLVEDAMDEDRKASSELKEMDSLTENAPVKENAVEGEISASTEGINRTVAKATMLDNEGNKVEAKVAKIAEVENGEASLELEGGQTVKASEVDFGDSGIGLVYKAATEMVSGVGGFNVDAANLMVKGFNPSGSIQAAGAYVSGFNEAYRYGAMGYPVSALETGNVTSKLSVAQREAAYNLGKAYGNEKVAEKQAKIDSTVSIKAGKDSIKAAKKGKVYFDGSAVGKTLTERQRASLKGLRVVAEATGVDIHIFESKVGKDGKRQGENGWYDPVTKEIHLDLHAGASGNGLMLFTASHELTHHIREVAPTKFKVFADALLEEYTKNGVSLDELISRKLETLEANGRLEGKTKEEAYGLAYEEVVADAAESMLVDSNAIEALSRKIQAKDKGLWETIKDFIAKLVARIKAAYEGIDPDSREGKLVREMSFSAERLQKLWVDALLEASEVNTVLGENGIIVNSKTDSASLMSVRDVLTDADRKKVSKALAERFGVTQAEAMDWLKAETSLASLILNPKYSQYLDYTGDPNEEAIKSNSDYPQGTVDFSNICKKRRDFTEVMNRVLRNFPNHVFAATDLAKIRTIMEQEGMEVACAICYVEDRRQLDSVVAQDFIDSLAIYREGGKVRPDGKPFNANQLKAFSLIEGDTYTPSIYELISLEGRNSLKAKNPAMEEAWVKFNNARGMQSVRLLLNDAEYKRQILKYSKSTVNRKNDLGGLRIYSFSDMEMFHLIDIIQVITDSATVGLSLQGYTKVNEYAKAVKDTGEKLNRSLIPKGDLGYHMEGGRVVLDFDTVEGIDINHPDFFDNIDNPNIGNIVIGINATQIKAAMTSKFIDQIIPFHTGQSGEVLGEKGIAAWENYKDFQSERDASTKKKSSHQINIYTEVINAAEAEGHPITNKVEFVNKFLQVCKENNLIPRFSEFLNVDENGDYVYTEGYHKFLVDFKTFDQNTGEYLPQMPVKPIFDNEYITKLLTDYVKTQQAKDAEFTKAMPKVLDRITKEIVKADGVKYSDRDSLGNELSKEQVEYFKDSKVRDKKGNLLVLYHGTTANFNTFKKGDVGFHFGTKGAARGRVGFGKNVTLKEVYLNITNPIVFDEDLGSWDADFRLTRELYDKGILTQADAESVLFTDNRQYRRTTEAANKKLASVLLEKGYDGIAYSNTFETKKATTSYIVFNSNQAKEITNKAPTSNPDIRYSDRASYAPTFYSHMGKVIDDIKLEKMGTSSILNHLKNRGVKDEEIKWSGIEAWLEGKKSVTKAELQEFVAGSQLQIEEEMSGRDIELRYDHSTDSYTVYDGSGDVIDTYTYDADRGGYASENDDEVYEYASDLEKEMRYIHGSDNAPRHSQYKLEGGTNYRELVFKMPNSTYSNNAMRGHWGQEAEGVLAHARIQDFEVDGKKMLFIEEIQSDWHNEGREKGYTNKEYEDAVAVYDRLAEDYANKRRAFNKYVRSSEFRSDSDEVGKKKFDWLRSKMETAEKRMQAAERDVDALKEKGMGDVPDAPFRSNYHEYVLKRLLRMAAEEGYDSIGWTPSEIQSQRWSEDYAEGYRIEYDQDIPKFLRKYGKKWGATVGHTMLDQGLSSGTDIELLKEHLAFWQNELSSESPYSHNSPEFIRSQIEYTEEEIRKAQGTGETVWYMDITDSMKDSVLYEGQAMYQDRNTDSYSNRSLLAGALETAAQNDIEREKLKQYKQKIDLINAEEQKLYGLRAQIKELSFAKGKRDTEAIKKLQFDANQAANRINTYDKQLLNLESTKALRGVLEREKALARKRDAQKYKEAQERYREKAAKTQRELMDRYQESRKKATEGRNKTAMRYKIKGIVSELNTLLLKPTAKKHIKEELRKEVADALSAINMDTVGADERVAMYNALIAKEKNPDVITELTKTRDRIQLQGDSLKEKLGNLQSAYEKIKNTDDIELNLAYQEVIQNSIKAVSEKVGNTSIRNMTLEQLEMVYDLFKMIRTTIRVANKSFKAKKGQTIMQMAEAVNDQVRTVGGQPYKRNAISAEIQRVGWTFLKPFVAFRTIGSITLTNMYKELRNGEDTFYGDVKEAQAFIEAQYKKHGYKSWDMKKTKTFTAKSGKSFDLTLEQMMTLYAYSKRDQAHDHIIQGGIVFEDALVTEKNKWGIPIKYEVTTKDAFNLSEETFKEICDYLEKEHKDAAAFVNEMQAYLSDTMGAKGNEVSMELLGVKLFKEKFYLPIKSSQYYMNFKAEEAGEVKLKSPAFSKETVQHANNPIVVHNFTDLWAEHINDMSMYHSFVLALEDFTRVYNYKTKTDAKVETMDTKATLETAYPGVTNYINKFLKDMNGGVRGETVGWAEKLTSLSKKGSVLGSASVTIQQPSAVMRAMAYISPKYFVTTAHQSINLAKHKADWAELKQYAPIAGIKEMGRFDVGMGQGTVDWIKSDKTVLEKGEDILSMPPAFMDEVTWLTIWNAVKRETVHNNPGLATSSEEFLKLAGERFTEVISLSQVYDSVFSRSDLMRNKSWIAKSLTAFMAEPSTTLNMLWDSYVQGKRTGSKKGFVKSTATVGGSIVAATVFNAALKSIIMAMRDDDEDESYAEKYLEHFVGDLKDSLNPLGLIPFVKDILSIFQGYDVERMDMAMFSDLKKAIDAFDSDSKTLYDKWSGLIGAISAFFGVPVKNVERDVRGFITTIFGETEETTVEGMLNAIKEGWTGKENSKGKQLYNAYLKGDKEQIKRIEGRFKDQSAIDSAIRKALRENDPRIKEAAEAYLEGDYATYNALRDEIVNEGVFDRKLVTDALKAEYNYLKDKAKED